MPVLKQHHTTPAMREAIVLDLGDIGAQAARIRAAAETQAQQIISKAQLKAEQAAQQRGDEAAERGYHDGLERGLAEGREQGRAEALAQSAEQLRQLMEAWSQVATDWEQQRTEMEREARQAVIEFALRTAEKIVHRVIEVDQAVVVDQAAQALSMVLSAHNASVRIHPVDRPMLEDAMPQLLAEMNNLEHIDLVDDEEVTPGGCVVAFGQGRVDATVERQMQRLVDLILPAPEVEDIDIMAQAPEADEVSAPPAELQQGALESFEQAADDSAPDSAAPPATPQPLPPPPVFEITEDGLVEQGGAQGIAPSEDTTDQANRASPDDAEDQPESEA